MSHTPALTSEEIKQKVERIQNLLRAAGQELYELDAEAVRAGQGWQLESFHPLLQEIQSYISTPDWASPGWDI